MLREGNYRLPRAHKPSKARPPRALNKNAVLSSYYNDLEKFSPYSKQKKKRTNALPPKRRKQKVQKVQRVQKAQRRPQLREAQTSFIFQDTLPRGFEGRQKVKVSQKERLTKEKIHTLSQRNNHSIERTAREDYQEQDTLSLFIIDHLKPEVDSIKTLVEKINLVPREQQKDALQTYQSHIKDTLLACNRTTTNSRRVILNCARHLEAKERGEVENRTQYIRNNYSNITEEVEQYLGDSRIENDSQFLGTHNAEATGNFLGSVFYGRDVPELEALSRTQLTSGTQQLASGTQINQEVSNLTEQGTRQKVGLATSRKWGAKMKFIR